MSTRFDTKIAILIRDDLAGWQAANVTAFLSAGIAAATPEIIGADYADADGTEYLATFAQPVLVLAGPLDVLRSAHAKALGRGLRVGVFTADLFATGNDLDNRAAVAAVPGADLDLVGLGVHGPRNAVDKILKGARMYA